jgi:phosphoglycolate phosphatase
MAFDLLVFDLDGTLIDSKRDLAMAVNATRESAGLGPLEFETISSYVGNGAPMLVRRALGPGASAGELEHALQFFYSYYRQHMLDHTRLYDGVFETLQSLQRGGRALAVLTNKPVRFSRDILDGLGVGSLLARVYGGNSFQTKKPDPEGLRHLMEELAVPPAKTLMVGDSAVDVETARNAAVLCCGVTYGLRPETLEQAPPDALIHRFEDLLPIACNGIAPRESVLRSAHLESKRQDPVSADT